SDGGAGTRATIPRRHRPPASLRATRAERRADAAASLARPPRRTAVGGPVPAPSARGARRREGAPAGASPAVSAGLRGPIAGAPGRLASAPAAEGRRRPASGGRRDARRSRAPARGPGRRRRRAPTGRAGPDRPGCRLPRRAAAFGGLPHGRDGTHAVPRRRAGRGATADRHGRALGSAPGTGPQPRGGAPARAGSAATPPSAPWAQA